MSNAGNSNPGGTSFNEQDSSEKELPPIPKKRKRSAASSTSSNAHSLTSEVWQHYTLNEARDKAICKYCSKKYAWHSKQTKTSTLWTHFETKCPKNPYKKLDSRQSTLSFKPKSKEQLYDGPSFGLLKSVAYNEHDIRNELAKMIIVDELPFRFVEGEGFRNYSRAMQPRFIVPSRVTVARDCVRLYETEKEKLKVSLKGQRVCLTIDTWTSVQNLTYMAITGHWIDEDWNLHKRILNYCQVPDHTGETISMVIEESLMVEWGIKSLFTVTVDNASCNNVAISNLKRRTRSLKGTILDHEFMYVRCFAHIVNLIVREGLEIMAKSIVKIRNSVRYVRSSPSRLQSFKKYSEKLEIDSKKLVCLDVETRWNSTYLMLEAALKFEKVFTRMEEDDRKYLLYFNLEIIGPPSKYDWEKAKFFVNFLKLFYNVTLKFLGSLHVTSNKFFNELISMHHKLITMTKSDDYEMSFMSSRMKAIFDKYWDGFDKLNPILYVATILDPRYKLKFINFGFKRVFDEDKVKEMCEMVETTFIRLVEHYGTPKSNPNSLSKSVIHAPTPLDVDDDDDDIALQFSKELQGEELVDSKSEMIRYLAEACEKVQSNTSFDILCWWKVNSTRYPTLSRLARDVLAIPVSSIASELAFSTGGRILDSHKSSLFPKIAEMLICGQNWLSSKPIPLEEQKSIEDMEKFEEIELEMGRSSIQVDPVD